MQITEALIDKFFANDCTAEEAAAVHVYLTNNPDVLEQRLQKDWNHTPVEGELSPAESIEMLEAVKSEAFVYKRPFLKRPVTWVSIAASVLIVALLWWLVPKVAAGNEQIAIDKKESNNKNKEIAATWKDVINTSGNKMQVTLQDGSIVTLSPEASLHYRQPFTGNKRDIELEGEAFFEVAKDKSRPFTVYAGKLATTALGTSFSVHEDKTGCVVQLHTGKVSIRAVDASVNPVVLLPGQQMRYSALDGAVAIDAFNESNLSTATGNKKVKALYSKDKMTFDNVPLNKVADELGRHYHVSIEYNKDEIAGMYFSGTVLKKDPVHVILNVIAQMNGLTVEHEANGFMLKKIRQ